MRLSFETLQNLIKIAKAAEQAGGIVSPTDVLTPEFIAGVLHEISDQNPVVLN